jgi:putative flippase GtrA
MPILSQPLETGSRNDSLIRAILFDSSDNTYVQFARYTVVGSAALLVDFGTLFLLTRYAGIYYLTSAAISFTLGLVVNYWLSRTWVFSHRTLANPALEFAIFAAIGLAGLGLNELGMWLLTSKLGMFYLLAKIVTAAVVYIWNFGARKYSLFR